MRLRASCANSTTSTISMRRGNIGRNVVGVLLLVAIIGGFAWMAQYLPTWNKTPQTVIDPTNKDKPGLIFGRAVAQWYPPRAPAKGDKNDGMDDQFPSKDFEQGTDGYYDFLFKNVTETEIDITNYTSDCDCNSVQVCTLPMDETERLAKFHSEKPGEPLPYANKPDLKKVLKDAKDDGFIRVKVGEGGVVRVNFNAKKSPGQRLNVRPWVWYQPVGLAAKRGGQQVVVPVMVKQPVNFNPQRVSVGILTANATADARLVAWSSTRSELKLELGSRTDPFFKVKIEPLPKEEFASLEETLKAEKNTATVHSAVQVTVTVHEAANEGKQQLDLGSFYRKLPVYLDGILNTDIHGPEIVGRVEGNLMIGGADDQGRVRFKSFDADNGGKKIVEISADEKAILTTYSHQPSWVEVTLKLDKKNAPPKRRIWILEARVPANTPSVRSFEEPDSIVLQVKIGAAERLVRIPLEGHIGGR